jgi:transposase-like protein
MATIRDKMGHCLHGFFTMERLPREPAAPYQRTERLCGLEITSAQVSRAAEAFDEELQKWRDRPLGETPYLILDARYEKVRHGGSVVSCAVLVAIGIDTEGKRSVLGVSVSLSEAEAHWRDFLASLQARGLHGVKLVTSDAHAGLKEALAARLSGVPWQRCQFHTIRAQSRARPILWCTTCVLSPVGISLERRLKGRFGPEAA